MHQITARALFLLATPAMALAAGFHGTWDATITPTAGADPVAFRMEVTETPTKVCFFEDAQPVCSTSARIEDGRLVAQWDFLKTELRLEARDKTLAGVYHLYRSNRDMNVEARVHQPLPASSAAPAKLDGEWEARVVPDRPGAPSWQLLLRQSGNDIKGTILRVDGDDGTMVGRVDGKHFEISHFSGDRPVAIAGDVLPDGTLDLKMGRTKLVGLRPADARARNLAPPLDPSTFARAKNPDEPFHFRFPDLNGRVYTEADFRGKPLIVTITGSWCPNCRDEAPFLAELYERYHAKGLEIAAFCFEEDSDPEHVQLAAFVRKFGMRYPALLAGPPAGLKTQVPQIENLAAYPSSIYIGRDGRVRSVHTGFPGPGSGEELTRVKQEIRALVERMLAEPVVAKADR
jgi:thiol-disulfide isomerase/thioredoxin